MNTHSRLIASLILLAAGWLFSAQPGRAATASWQSMTIVNAPNGTRGQTEVWTGKEWLIWGGEYYYGSGVAVNTGARYNPATDTWTPITTTGAPSPRRYHTAVWTGTEMLIWGGEDSLGSTLNTGGRYNPATDTWTSITVTNAPSARYWHSAVWTGTEMIIWGGNTESSYDLYPTSAGGRYNPATDTWQTVSAQGGPAGVIDTWVSWTGQEMLVWGGVLQNRTAVNTGARYNPTTGAWSPMATTGAPSPRGHSSTYGNTAWTGDEMLVWGGYDDTGYINAGARYNPVTNTWTPISAINAPAARDTPLIWTGTEMVVWGGYGGSFLTTGARYRPAADSWTPMDQANEPSPRDAQSETWTGSELLVWGGYAGQDTPAGFLHTGGRYNPAFDATNNQPPSASPGGPYSIITGGATTLSGSGIDPDGDSLTYAWDLDNNGSFETPGQNVTFSAVGRDPGSQIVALQVCDTKGACTTASTTVTILSTLAITTESPLPGGTVGVPYTVTLAATGGTAPYTWSVDSGQLPPGLNLNASTGEISGTPTAAGTFGFTIRVTDNSQVKATKQFALAPPLPPALPAGTSYPPTPIIITPPTSGGSTTPTCTNYVLAPGSDPLPLGMFLDEATGVISGTPTNGGTYHFTVQCTYNTNQTATADFTITINNPVPTLTSLDPDSLTAGAPGFALTVTGTNFVNGSKVLWNGAERPTTYVSATQLTATIAATDVAAAGAIPVTVENAAPGGGTSNALTFTVNPANRPPVASAGQDQTVNEGATVTLDASGSSDPDGDSLTYSWSIVTCSGPAVTLSSTTAAKPTFVAPDNEVCTFQVAVADGRSGNDTAQVTVTILNVKPRVATPTVAPEPSNEGDAVVASATFSDPGAADAPFTCTVDYGDGSGAGPGTVSGTTCTGPAHTYADNGDYTVTVAVTDKDAGTGQNAATHAAKNVAPTVGAITAPLDPVQLGAAVTAGAAFTDPGTLDTHTATWGWGDGTTSPGAVTETNGSGSVSGGHTYAAAGVYTITLTVTDKDGASGAATFQYVVVYDPAGGFVTGGGWIDSPAGACKLASCSDGTTGKASFGFVAKYQNGANVPTGSTEFQFQAGGLNFHSTAYDWLVVAGSKAQFKGSGTINGQGDYGFMLTAIDGSPDRFRIKIWDKATGAVVYDNQMGATDSSDPTTALGGGSIQIHK